MLKMQNLLDLTTKVTKQALDVLFFSNPYGTTMGVTLGVMISEFLRAFSPSIQDIMGLDVPTVSPIGWVTFGVFIFNARFLFRKNPDVPEEVHKLFALIQEAKRAGISDIELKQQYRIIIEKYTNVALNKKTELELQKIKEKLNNQLDD